MLFYVFYCRNTVYLWCDFSDEKNDSFILICCWSKEWFYILLLLSFWRYSDEKYVPEQLAIIVLKGYFIVCWISATCTPSKPYIFPTGSLTICSLSICILFYLFFFPPILNLPSILCESFCVFLRLLVSKSLTKIQRFNIQTFKDSKPFYLCCF